jgi:tRNA(Ile)-lysidine synthase
MDIVQQVRQTILQKNLFNTNDTLLVAVSGGADSVVLCHILKELQYDFAIAHINFQLREVESNSDAAFVQELASTLQAPFFIHNANTITYASEKKLSIQVAAREIRYAFFASIINEATQKPFAKIITAHHANDVVETALMHFCKGTGIQGLKSIPIKNGNIVRPLLQCTRQSIEAYASQNNIAFVTDSSNVKNDYTRNYVRNIVMPLLQEQWPTITQNILNTVQYNTDAALLYEEIVQQKITKIVEPKGNELHIPILKLRKEKATATLLYQIVLPYGFASAQIPEIEKLYTANNSSYVASVSHKIIKNRNWLLIVPNHTIDAANIYIEKDSKEVQFVGGSLQLNETTNLQENTNQNIGQLNAAKLEYPLLLRPYKEGDYFYPLGMTKKKKLARFFIDQKLSATEKKQVWVLESNGKIVWVVGYRINDRYKVTEATKSICLLTFKRR